MNFIIAPNGTTLLGYFCNQNLSPNTIKRHPIWSHWPLVRAYNVHPLAKCYFWGRGGGGGLVVSVLTFFSDDISSNPAEATVFLKRKEQKEVECTNLSNASFRRIRRQRFVNSGIRLISFTMKS